MPPINAKFLLVDGGHIMHDVDNGSLISEAKEQVAAKWPPERGTVTGAELKMIHSGKILEDNRTFASYNIPTTGQVVMHLMARPASQSAPKKEGAGGAGGAGGAAGGSNSNEGGGKCACVIS